MPGRSALIATCLTATLVVGGITVAGQRGAPTPMAKPARVTRISVEPAILTLRKGEEATLRVLAHHRDGEVVDVTGQATFSDRIWGAKNVESVDVDARGNVQAIESGWQVIAVEYERRTAAAMCRVAFGDAVDEDLWPQHNLIDKHLAAAGAAMGLKPAPPVEDATFCRRAYLDLAGRLPTVEELQSFVESRDPDKRQKLIEMLLESPAYAGHWAMIWSEWLLDGRNVRNKHAAQALRTWLRDQLAGEGGLDQLAAKLLSASGDVNDDGAVGFYASCTTPQRMAETASEVFLGRNIRCGRCHDAHACGVAMRDYHGLAAVFRAARVRSEKSEPHVQLLVDPRFQYHHAGEAIRPRVFEALRNDGRASTLLISASKDDDPRRELAKWLTGDGRRTLARSMVNRYWRALLGRGLVDPVDDMRASNPASHPELLEALVDDFLAHDLDPRHLITTICASAAYQRESKSDIDPDNMYFARFQPRRLPAEVLMWNVRQATLSNAVEMEGIDLYGYRSFHAHAARCNRDGEAVPPSGPLTGCSDTMMRMLQDPAGRGAWRLPDDEVGRTAMIEQFYLVTIARRPTDEEWKLIAQFLARDESDNPVHDLLWALMNTREFLFNQ